MFAYVLSIRLRYWLQLDTEVEVVPRTYEGLPPLSLLGMAARTRLGTRTSAPADLAKWHKGNPRQSTEWQQWQSRYVHQQSTYVTHCHRFASKCMDNTWIVTATLNRVVVPFALSRALCILEHCATTTDRGRLSHLIQTKDYSSEDIASGRHSLLIYAAKRSALDVLDQHFRILQSGSSDRSQLLLSSALFISSRINVSDAFKESLSNSYSNWVRRRSRLEYVELRISGSNGRLCANR